MERRLAAILAADVVGYTRLMGSDEAGTLQRFTTLSQDILEPLIAEHYGRVVKLMGDGLLVEFASAFHKSWLSRGEKDASLPHDTPPHSSRSTVFMNKTG